MGRDPVVKRATKINAARLLNLCGWSPEEIAAVTASRSEDVRKWLDRPDYDPRRRYSQHPCRGCGATDERLRNNGLCDPCIGARNDTIIDMKNDGMSYAEIAKAVGSVPETVRNILHRASTTAAALPPEVDSL